MLRTWLALGLMAVTLVTTAEGRIALSKSRLEFELLDGSKVCGEPVEADACLKVTTTLGQMRVPLVQLARIEMVDDREQAVLHFSNGDRLKGTIPANFEVQTLLGKMTVPWSKVRSLRVLPAPRVRFKAASVRVSGTYPPQPPEYATDSQPRAWSSGDWKGWYEIDLGSRREVSQLSITLQFDPTGPATHEFYISDEPMEAQRDKGKLLQRFSGERKNEDVLIVDCPTGTAGRYLQVHCPESRSWFNLIEFDVFGQ
jgi:hypothetical protein